MSTTAGLCSALMAAYSRANSWHSSFDSSAGLLILSATLRPSVAL
jgi:hypothetical protein